MMNLCHENRLFLIFGMVSQDLNKAKSNGLSLKGIIPILRQQKDWVGGSRKLPVLLTFSTTLMLIRRVGGVQKGQKYADVI